MTDWLFSGMLVQFPELKLAYSEGQIGWIPYILERADTVWEEHRAWAGAQDLVPEPPSTYYYRQIYGCFFRDQHGIDAIDKVGVDNTHVRDRLPAHRLDLAAHEEGGRGADRRHAPATSSTRSCAATPSACCTSTCDAGLARPMTVPGPPASSREAAGRFGDAAALVVPDGGDRVTYARAARGEPTPSPPCWRAAALGEGAVVALDLPSDAEWVVAYAAAAKLGGGRRGHQPPPGAARAGGACSPGRARPWCCRRRGGSAGRRGRRARVVGGAPPGCPTTPTGRSPSCSRRAPPASPRARCSASASSTPSPPSTPAAPGPTRGAAAAAMLASTQFAHIGFTTKLPWYLRLAPRTHILGPVAGRRRAADHRRAAHAVDRRRGRPGRAAAARRPRLRRATTVDRADDRRGRRPPRPPALVAEARDRFGAAYSIRYSSTESGGCGTGTAFDADDDEALHTVGRPRPGVEVSVRDDDGHEVPAGEVGELWLRSPTHDGGLLARPRGARRRPSPPTAGCAPATWPASTADGLVRLAGRAKEMFIRGGYNVYPAEVEAVLARPPRRGRGGRRAPARRGHGRDRRGRRRRRATRRRRRPSTTCGRSSRPRSPPTSSPRRSRIVDELPLTPMQKVDRRSLAAAEVDRSVRRDGRYGG